MFVIVWGQLLSIRCRQPIPASPTPAVFCDPFGSNPAGFLHVPQRGIAVMATDLVSKRFHAVEDDPM
jgi:hypothetical protein